MRVHRAGIGAGCCGPECGCGPCRSLSGLGTTTTTPTASDILSSIQSDISSGWNDLQSMNVAGIPGGYVALGVVAAVFLFGFGGGKRRRR